MGLMDYTKTDYSLHENRFHVINALFFPQDNIYSVLRFFSNLKEKNPLDFVIYVAFIGTHFRQCKNR